MIAFGNALAGGINQRTEVSAVSNHLAQAGLAVQYQHARDGTKNDNMILELIERTLQKRTSKDVRGHPCTLEDSD